MHERKDEQIENKMRISGSRFQNRVGIEKGLEVLLDLISAEVGAKLDILFHEIEWHADFTRDLLLGHFASSRIRELPELIEKPREHNDNQLGGLTRFKHALENLDGLFGILATDRVLKLKDRIAFCGTDDCRDVVHGHLLPVPYEDKDLVDFVLE